MKLRIVDNGNTAHAELMLRKLSERLPVEPSEDGLTVVLRVDPALAAAESYRISRENGGFAVTGSDSLGLYYGVGRLLHTAVYTEKDFIPDPPQETVTPHCTFRAIYFSVHNYNWYHLAPTEDLVSYLEDMLLWGFNAIHCIVPVMNIYEIGDGIFKDGVARARRLYTLARKVGLKTSFGVNPNQGVLGSPHEFDADETVVRWKAGRNLCPSKPGAVEHLRTIWRAKLEEFRDIGLDFIHTWPYDEGGCSCEKCRPWGSNKYLDVSLAFYAEAKRYYPEAKLIASTWCFDTQPVGASEYAGLYARLSTDLSLLDYIMVDSHGDYPAYVLEHDVVKPVVNFPEISMWGLYPWGGFGANPLPKRFQRIWDSSKHVLAGGMPYSEGLYEDILKIQCVGYYFSPDRHYTDILAEYISYEYGREVVPEVLALMELIEENHARVEGGEAPDLAVAERALTLAEQVNAAIPEARRVAWRWRILYLRAVLDEKRYRAYHAEGLSGADGRYKVMRRSGVLLQSDPEAQEIFRELIEIYHCVDYNGQNRWTHPPVDGGAPEDLDGRCK